MLSPYLLPDGNVQIAFSGGRTSAYMLHEILEANGSLPDRVEVTFQNTGREMPQTLDFVAEVAQRWGVLITWLEYRPVKPLFEVVGFQGASRNGELFDALIAKKKALPNVMQAWCSAELKTLTAKRYLVHKGWKAWTSAIGFRSDEPHRTPREDTRSTPWLPLRDACVGRSEVADFWASQNFDLDLPLVNGRTIDGNCDGCFLKSEETQASLACRFPARHAWWEGWEEKTGRHFSKRFSRRELREFVERQCVLDLSTDGQFCQANEGECAA